MGMRILRKEMEYDDRIQKGMHLNKLKEQCFKTACQREVPCCSICMCFCVIIEWKEVEYIYVGPNNIILFCSFEIALLTNEHCYFSKDNINIFFG